MLLCESKPTPSSLVSSLLANHDYVGSRVTCKGSLYNAFPPILADGLEEPPDEEEFPSLYADRLLKWQNQPVPRHFTWSNSRDLFRFLTNGRWLKDNTAQPGGVVGFSSINDQPVPVSDGYKYDVAFRNSELCAQEHLPFTGEPCPGSNVSQNDNESPLISILRTFDQGKCNINIATATAHMLSLRATLFTCQDRENTGINCKGNGGGGFFVRGMPGAALILSINELIVCLGIETKAQAVEGEAERGAKRRRQ